MTERISITRGLVKLKILTKQIEEKINKLTIVGISVGDKAPLGYITKGDFKKMAESNYNSLTDLIKLRSNIKSAIVKSNAETTVLIGKETMSVAEAIERKNSIEFEEKLLQTIERQFSTYNNQVEEENEKVNYQLQNLVESSFGGKDKKIEKTDYDNIAVPYLAVNQRKLVNPLKVEGIVEDLSSMIDDFNLNVNVVLSESNAGTYIEI
jgi:hypothetical protein